jgi:hypothetical protein
LSEVNEFLPGSSKKSSIQSKKSLLDAK